MRSSDEEHVLQTIDAECRVVNATVEPWPPPSVEPDFKPYNATRRSLTDWGRIFAWYIPMGALGLITAGYFVGRLLGLAA